MSYEKLRELSDSWLARADFLRGINGSKSDTLLACRGELNELLEVLDEEELSPFQQQLKNFKNERRINISPASHRKRAIHLKELNVDEKIELRQRFWNILGRWDDESNYSVDDALRDVSALFLMATGEQPAGKERT